MIIMNRLCRAFISQTSRNYGNCCSSELHNIRLDQQIQFLIKTSSQSSSKCPDKIKIPQIQLLLKSQQVQSYTNIDKIDPVIGSKVYRTPSPLNNFDKLIFGVPMSIVPDITEPEIHRIVPLIDPNEENKPKIEAHKRHLYWRRRSMKRHRYMRWRKRNEVMLKYKKSASREKKQLRRKKEIESIWRASGLEKEPPKLSQEEKRSLTEKWRYQGVWDDMNPQEVFKFATAPEPKNKKTLPESKRMALKRRPL